MKLYTNPNWYAQKLTIDTKSGAQLWGLIFLICWVAPWSYFYDIGIYRAYVDWMSQFFPSMSNFKNQLADPSRRLAYLAAYYPMSLLWMVIGLFNLQSADKTNRGPITWRIAIVLLTIFFVFSVFMLLFMLTWGLIEDPTTKRAGAVNAWMVSETMFLVVSLIIISFLNAFIYASFSILLTMKNLLTRKMEIKHERRS